MKLRVLHLWHLEVKMMFKRPLKNYITQILRVRASGVHSLNIYTDYSDRRVWGGEDGPPRHPPCHRE
ncbi:hypothetical protein Hanom_Chr10g00934431 [Helianthus anomalus]